jgi:Mn-containing catalase
MPNGSFRLVLDGDPIPDMASQIFEAVKGDACRQAALDLCQDRDILRRQPGFLRHRGFWKNYQWEGLPEAVTKLQNGEYASIITCNFDLGAPCDPEHMINEREGWDYYDWQEEWRERQTDTFDTVPPLPPWKELRMWGGYIRHYRCTGLR